MTWAIKTSKGLGPVGRSKSEAITRFMTELRVLDGETLTWDAVRVDRGLEVVRVKLVEAPHG